MNKRQEIREVFSDWNHQTRGLQYSHDKYYSSLEGKIMANQVDGIKTKRVTLSQRGAFSRKREYLRVTYQDLVFDICGAPFGIDAFFFSYRMGIKNMGGIVSFIYGILFSLPLIGGAIQKMRLPMTYYAIDTANMFHSLIMTIVQEEVQLIMQQEGKEPIPKEEMVPNSKNLSSI